MRSSPSPLDKTSLSLEARARSKLTHASALSTDVPPGVAAAAVLAALFEQENEPHVWLLRKVEHLRRHAGQIALPGGKHEPGDRSLLETALREANEEVGLRPDQVEIVGSLRTFSTRTGFHVTPFIGLLKGPFEPVADPGEVARIFSAPLRHFVSPGELRPVPSVPQVGMVPSYVVEGELVWGATAFILQALAAKLL